jgi:hypothetical protein
MIRICGQSRVNECRPRSPRVAGGMLLAAAALGLALPSVTAAGSPTQKQKPQPQQLWNRYPLDAAKASKARTLPVAGQSADPLRASDDSSTWPIVGAALVCAAIVAALALAVAALRSRRPWAGAWERVAERGSTRTVTERARPLPPAPERLANNDRFAGNGRHEDSAAAARPDVLRRASAESRPVDPKESPAPGSPAQSSEQATLKRKGAAAREDPVETLKRKAAVAPQSQDQRGHEATVLKAKLSKRRRPMSKDEPSSEFAGATPDDRSSGS